MTDSLFTKSYLKNRTDEEKWFDKCIRRAQRIIEEEAYSPFVGVRQFDRPIKMDGLIAVASGGVTVAEALHDAASPSFDDTMRLFVVALRYLVDDKEPNDPKPEEIAGLAERLRTRIIEDTEYDKRMGI